MPYSISTWDYAFSLPEAKLCKYLIRLIQQQIESKGSPRRVFISETICSVSNTRTLTTDYTDFTDLR